MRSSVSAAATPTIISDAATDAGASRIIFARIMFDSAKNRPRLRPGRLIAAPTKRSVATRAEQLHQHHEQVDEVEIEAQRPHDRLLAGDLGPVALVIHLLDLLRIPRGQTGEDDDPDHRDRKLKCRGGE